MMNAATPKGSKARKDTPQNATAIYQSVEELAKEIGISRQSAYAGLRANVIPHIRLGKRYILPRAAIGEWLKNPGTFDFGFGPGSSRFKSAAGLTRH